MPTVYSAITEMTEHIHDVVVKQMTHKIVRDLNPLTDFADKIYIDTGYSAAQQASDGSHNSVLRNNKVMVKASPIINPTNLKWNAITGMHDTGQFLSRTTLGSKFPTVFADSGPNVRLLEMCVPTQLRLEFELELVSRDQAYEIPAQLYRRYMSEHVFSEILVYDYPIPTDIITRLYAIYKMRRFSTPMTFREYLKKCSNNLIQYNVPRSEPNGPVEVVIPKTLSNVIVTIEYNEDKPQEVVVGRSTNAYQINFTLIAQYERADMVILQFPAVVDNKLISEKMIPAPTTELPLKSLDTPYPNKTVNDQANVFLGARMIDPIRMPFYDDWELPKGLAHRRSYREFLVAGFLIDEQKNTTEIDLSEDLDEKYKLHDIVKKILKKQGRDSFRYDCIFPIEVYWGDSLLEPTQLELTEDLVLKIPCNDIHRAHRLVMYEITDVKYLDPKWYEDIAEWWPYFRISDQIKKLYDSGLLDINDNGTIYDPKNNVLGGTNDSHRPLRRILADIIAKRGTPRNR